MAERKKKKPLHKLILDEMEACVELVPTSSRAEQDLRKFSNMFRNAILPKDKRAEIIERIKALLKRPMSTFPAKDLEELVLTLNVGKGIRFR